MTADQVALTITPVIVILVLVYATYAIVAHLCVEFLLRDQGKTGTAIALLILFSLFFLLAWIPYARTFYNAQWNPGAVSSRNEGKLEEAGARTKGEAGQDLEALAWTGPDQDLDSPGLEAFYSKDVFICEADGRPRWCAECRQWKPDRARHSRVARRCIHKMDHLCPWVGGIVSETSFNFFIQFTLWCSGFLTVCIATASYSLWLQNKLGRPTDGRTIAVLALAAFFLFFSFSMFIGSLRLAVLNQTSIDNFNKSSVTFIAVRIPLDTPNSRHFPTITYPLALETPSTARTDQTDAAEWTATKRDRQAQHKFAILRTEPGENPFNLGWYENFKSVMGNNVLEWLLPVAHSPCCNHDSMISDYPYGRLLKTLRRRCDLPKTREANVST